MQLRPVKLPRVVLVVLRVTVGLLFMVMGSWKIGAQDFSYGDGDPVGELFAFMEATGLWWDLVGWSQVVAGALLVTQRFATVGALVLFGVTLNVAAVNVALWPAFGTTVWFTAYAFVALALLLLHDLDKWQYVFWKRAPTVLEPGEGP